MESFQLSALELELIPFAVGILLVIVLGFLVEPFLALTTEHLKWKDTKKRKKRWVTFTAAGRTIGVLEGILFFVSIVIQYPIFIGAWLVFKVAAKWETRAHIVRLDETESKDLKSEEFETRAMYSSWVHSRFIIGTLSNIAIAVIGAWAYLQVSKYCGAS
jgi:hypothetical protein